MRSRISRVPGGAAAAVVLGLLVLAVAGLVVFDLVREDRIADGVRVEGVEIGGRSAAEATEIVREQIHDPVERTIVASHGNRELELAPDESQIEVDVEATVDAAVREERGPPGVRALRDLLGTRRADVDLDARVRHSQEAVSSFAQRVARELDRRARDADLEPSADGLEKVRHRRGFRTDREELERRLVAALESRDEHEVQVPGQRIEPDTKLADLARRYPHYIVIDRAGFRLRYYRELEQQAVYPISVGDAGHDTPAGRYDISTKEVNPTWHVPEAEWAGDLAGETVPPGPDNPLKSRWLGIEDGVGIHGTDETDSIGSRASHGCIRMLVPDVEELYAQVPIGTPVYIG